MKINKDKSNVIVFFFLYIACFQEVVQYRLTINTLVISKLHSSVFINFENFPGLDLLSLYTDQSLN